jgi:hypothetical protein
LWVGALGEYVAVQRERDHDARAGMEHGAALERSGARAALKLEMVGPGLWSRDDARHRSFGCRATYRASAIEIQRRERKSSDFRERRRRCRTVHFVPPVSLPLESGHTHPPSPTDGRCPWPFPHAWPRASDGSGLFLFQSPNSLLSTRFVSGDGILH